MTVPNEVRAAAATAVSSELPPTIAALQYELASGNVCGAGVASLAWLHSVIGDDDPIFDPIGGRPGSWWSAMQAPGLPHSMRNEDVDAWAVEKVCTAPPEIWVTAMAGQTRPRYIRSFDAQAGALDEKTHAMILSALEQRLAQIIRGAGLEVVSRLKDQGLKDEFRKMELPDVVDAARSRWVRDKNIMAVTGVRLERIIDRAVEDLIADIVRILSVADEEAKRLWRDTFGIVPENEADSDERIQAAAVAAGEELRRVAERRLEPKDPVLDSQEDLELGERSSSSVGAGIATTVMLFATALNAARTQTGIVRTSDGESIPTVSRRPGMKTTVERQLLHAGQTMATLRRQAAIELERIRQQIAIVEETLDTLQLAAQVDEARRAITDLTDQLNQRADDLEDEIGTVERGFGLNSDSTPLAEGIAEGRVRFSEQTIFVHAASGTPNNPFPPHVALDQIIVGSVEWEEQRVAAYEYTTKDGDPRSTQPFSSLGTWYPGDHPGCTCGYTTTTTIEVIEPDLREAA